MAEKKRSFLRRVLRLDPALSMGQRGWDLYTLLKTSGVLAGGSLMYYLGTLTEWARALGPLGIALIVVAVVLLLLLSIAAIRSLLSGIALKPGFPRWLR